MAALPSWAVSLSVASTLEAGCKSLRASYAACAPMVAQGQPVSAFHALRRQPPTIAAWLLPKRRLPWNAPEGACAMAAQVHAHAPCPTLARTAPSVPARPTAPHTAPVTLARACVDATRAGVACCASVQCVPS